tara:strand:+ start:1599 stop:2189 length:591 start_codon:yes stop_codon:yes gene_type:complete
MNIHELLSDLNELLESTNKVPGIRNKVFVDYEKLTNFSAKMKTSISDNIEEAEEIVKQKESIIKQAQLESYRVKNATEVEVQELMNAAEMQKKELVQESEIVKSANQEAIRIKNDLQNECEEMKKMAEMESSSMMEQAELFASERKEGANQYAKETLFELEERFSKMLGQVRKGLDSLSEIQDVQDEKGQVLDKVA